MKQVLIFLLSISCYGCFFSLGCEHIHSNSVGETEKPYAVKKITIVNHINKTYKDNGLYTVDVKKKNGIWKMYYSPNNEYYQYYPFHNINTIKANKTIYKNENGKALELKPGTRSCGKDFEGNSKEYFFVCSLDDGKRKIFFGASGYDSKKVWKNDYKVCKRYFIRWDIHPVWQEKELTIHIYNDKITFSDPKIKEVKKVTASKSKEEIELKNLEIVPCDEE